MNTRKIKIPEKQITEFCKKWNIKELSLFGSVLTEDYSKDSDIDILVSFSDDSQHTLFDLVHMKDELKQLFGCDVDLVSRRGLESSRNYFRRNSILNSVEPLYATE
jgi:predicted nucleotidyltransferase